jgi:hypothetical protein
MCCVFRPAMLIDLSNHHPTDEREGRPADVSRVENSGESAFP